MLDDGSTPEIPHASIAAAGSFRRLFAAIRRGETRALARAVSLVEDCAVDCSGDGAADAANLLKLCRAHLAAQPSRALRIGITGPAGAGKSTLVDALTREFRAAGRRVGIVAVDPSSPFSGGAILGDRIRVGKLAEDSGVYMRSMATRGHLGGLARATDDVLTVIEAAWADLSAESASDVLLIETTGVGQGEIEIVNLADLVAVVLVPGMGDAVQSLKAGVLEIASIFVLNKADRDGIDGIDRLEADIKEMLALSETVGSSNAGTGRFQMPSVLRTVATTSQGVPELLVAIDVQGEDIRAGRQRFQPLALSKNVPPILPALPNAVLDHIGIAVRSIDAARRLYTALGAQISEVEIVPAEQVRVAMISAGESRIELLEATDENSTIGRFLIKRGEGLHHVALRISDLESTIENLTAQRIRMVSQTIQIGAGGHRYVFIHPSSANGVLVELVEADASNAQGRSS